MCMCVSVVVWWCGGVVVWCGVVWCGGVVWWCGGVAVWWCGGVVVWGVWVGGCVGVWVCVFQRNECKGQGIQMLLQSHSVLPEQVCQGRWWHLQCNMRCRTALLAPPATRRNCLRTLWTALASICVPTPTIQIFPCTLGLPWLWPWRAVAATPRPLQPNVRQSRCPRPPICSVLLPALGKSSLCLSARESRLPRRCLRLSGALRLHLSKGLAM